MQKKIRLTQIDKMINKHYSTIWDCCCDHGLLGMQLLQRHAADTIHFIDVVAELMTALTQQLTKYFPSPTHQWQTHCWDMQKFVELFEQQITQSIAQHKTTNADKQYANKHLIIIAGVGGEKTVEFITDIMRNITLNTTQQIEFILCPIHHNFKLREALIDLDMKLINEQLVKEKQRFYEIIHVTAAGNAQFNKLDDITAVGSSMWDFTQADHQDYLAKTITHYQRMAQNPKVDVNHIILAYQQLQSR